MNILLVELGNTIFFFSLSHMAVKAFGLLFYLFIHLCWQRTVVIFHPRMVLRTFIKAYFIIMVQFSSAGKVRVPKQLFVNTDPSSIPAAVRRAGLSLPLGKV